MRLGNNDVQGFRRRNQLTTLLCMTRRSYQEWEKMAKTIKKNYPLAGAQFTKV